MVIVFIKIVEASSAHPKFSKKDSHTGNVRTEVYTLLIEENPFEKGFFLKLLS